MIHEKSCRSIIFWVHGIIGHHVRPIDKVEGVLIDVTVTVLSDLTEGHHITTVGGHQFTFPYRPSSHQPLPFGCADLLDGNRES